MLYNVHVSTHTTNRAMQKNNVNILLILATIVVWRCNRSPRSPPVYKTTRTNPLPRIKNVQRVTVRHWKKHFVCIFYLCKIQLILNCTFYLQTQRLYCKVVKSCSLRVCEHPDLSEMPGLCEGVDPLVPPEQLPVPVHGDGEAAY